MLSAQNAPRSNKLRGPEDEVSLDGSTNVLLAPIRGVDFRRSLPKPLFERRPARFVAKFSAAMTLIVVGLGVMAWGLSAGGRGWIAVALSVAVVGVMYAHLVELQHECLHEHACRSRRLNRVFGFLCGVFMLSSFSHYKYDHLRHHAALGTSQNREFFNYRFRNLDSWWGFVVGAYHLGRYVDVFRNMLRSLLGRPIPGVNREHDLRRIRAEYRLFALILAAAGAGAALSGEYVLVLFAWVLPAILVAEATHFLIELPEHFGLNTQTDPNVLTNTRTITASRFAQWLTNSNNLHTAHHFHQGVPMVNVERLHEMTKDNFAVVDPSYWSFYRNVIRGDLRCQGADETCMTR